MKDGNNRKYIFGSYRSYVVTFYVSILRYTQTAVASFGPSNQLECGFKPGGFTRLTPEVLDWVMNHGIERNLGSMIQVRY